jgi:predicted Fe-Mo cluster-binding NifX family protein
MIIAIPLTHDETFSAHFGGSAMAAIFEVDLEKHAVVSSGIFRPTGLSPCAWGPWLRDLGVKRLLVGGMGEGARAQMEACGIEVVPGITAGEAQLIVRSWLRGTLVVGPNLCGHGSGGHEHTHAHEHGGSCGCHH